MFNENVDFTVPDLIKIINQHTEYIIKLENELKMFKDFYTAISENNIIGDKFKNYENKITNLQKKIEHLQMYEEYYKNNIRSNTYT
jgi:archaellum component FlaC